MSNPQTGTDNVQFDLVSVWYHALDGASTYAKYVTDAQQGGNQDVVKFFQDAQNMNKQLATRAQQLMQQAGGNISQSSQSKNTTQSQSSQNG